MTAEIKAGIEQEQARCKSIRAAFPDKGFQLLAIVRGWTVEEARAIKAKMDAAPNEVRA